MIEFFLRKLESAAPRLKLVAPYCAAIAIVLLFVVSVYFDQLSLRSGFAMTLVMLWCGGLAQLYYLFTPRSSSGAPKISLVRNSGPLMRATRTLFLVVWFAFLSLFTILILPQLANPSFNSDARQETPRAS